ncbi:MAG: N-acetyltransferase [Steroidobacteraceae bacterium]|nr:N-acetyltransferase [Steroidobacteraceae bacterium]
MNVPERDGFRLVRCTEAAHAGQILGIFNEAIANTTAIYEYDPRTPRTIADWFAEKRAAGHPVIGLLDAAGELAGFGTYGVFRARPAFGHTVEHSVYVHRQRRGRGAGARLLKELIAIARNARVHVMVGCIDAGNGASIAMHERAGFRCAGRIEQCGFKFGRWLDLVFYQLILDGEHRP